MASQARYAFLIFLLALFLRVAFLLGTFSASDNAQGYEDAQIAMHILHGDGYVYRAPWGLGPLRPTAAKPPVYPFLIAGVFWALGVGNFFALFALQALLSSFTCGMLFLSLRPSTHFRASATAGCAAAVYPPFVYHAATAESTTVLLFLISLTIYQLVTLGAAHSRGRWCMASGTGALVALVEPVAIPFVCLSFLYVASLTRQAWAATVRTLLGVGLVFLAVVGPWTLRNYLVFQHLVAIKTNGGWTLVDGLSRAGVHFPLAPGAKELTGLNEAEEDRLITRTVMTWIRAHPLSYARVLAGNIKEFWWQPDRYASNRTWSYLLGRRVPYVLLLLLAIPGVLAFMGLGRGNARGLVDKRFGTVALVLMATYTMVYTVVGGFLLRYHLPVELVMCGFLGGTVGWLTGAVDPSPGLDAGSGAVTTATRTNVRHSRVGRLPDARPVNSACQGMSLRSMARRTTGVPPEWH